MYLKSIEIFGFKSFAEKTRIDLQEGITGIVGPNGCGKSNIMESVRWCIGEMSWKSLRSTSMTDVIFNGTNKRPALSLSEVTLTFDNSDKALPIDFSEVTVARRIFRSGESGYFLNKAACRLRDIRELFLDTGIGDSGYSIIDQGGVNFILKSKPEERRTLFEEAAGVAKYKARREEALRKLDRVDADLNRLSDSTSIIEEQIRKLDIEARKAKQFEKHQAELKGLEVAQILADAGRLGEELERDRAEIGPMKERLRQGQTDLETRDAEVAKLNVDAVAQEKDAIEFNAALSELRSQVARLEERIAQASTNADHFATQLETARLEKGQEEQRLSALEPEESRLKAELEAERGGREARQAEFEKAKADADAARAELDAKREALKVLEAEHIEIGKQRIAVLRDLSERETSVRHLENAAASRLEELGEKEGRVESFRTELQTFSDEVDRSKADADRRAQAVHALELEDHLLEEEFRKNDGESREQDTVQVRARARLEALRVQGEQNPYWVGARAVLDANLPGVLGRLSELISVSEEDRSIVQEALGDRLDALVVEDASAADRALEHLRAQGKGRARLLLLSAIGNEAAAPVAAAPGTRSLTEIVRCESRFAPLVAALAKETYSKGRDVYGPYWVVGGGDHAVELPEWLDESSLSREIESASTRVQELRQRGEELRGKREALKPRLASERQAHQESLASVQSASARLASRREGLDQLLADTENVRKLSVEILGNRALRREEFHELSAQAGTLQSREEEIVRGLETGRQDLLAFEESSRRTFDAFREVESRFSQGEDRIRSLEERWDRFENERKLVQETLQRRLARIEEAETSIRENTAAKTSAEEELSGLSTGLAEKENRSRTMLEDLMKLREHIKDKDGELHALRTEVHKLEEKVHEVDVRLHDHETREELLKTKLWDTWQLAWEEAQAEYGQVEADADRVRTLRSKIESMGAINMTAPEEYAALDERLAFLRTQIEDLDAAKKDLLQAIQRINATTRESFVQTFEAVREHFRRIFGKLFEGGEADLILTDPENPLETGVEIIAQPPDKKLKSLSLLSGGEQTLTALALLFSFFSVRPSPLCILDEADAALDDANVDRFVAMLTDMVDKSQFLVVTHNKRTMEACDVLYGATMEESGVTQLMSMEIKKAQEVAAA